MSRSANHFFTGAGSGPANYIEEVFSTYLYTGNGTSQTITNGIDLSTKGGLVWIKSRDGTGSHSFYDTNRGVKKRLCSDLSAAEFTYSTTGVTAFGTTGFSIADNSNGDDNVNGAPGGTYSGTNALYTSWTFRKQAKFFDVVTYTGNGINNRAISHNLGSTPGCIIFKSTSASSDWIVYHRSLGQDFANDNIDRLRLNSSAGQSGVNGVVNDVSSTTFTLGNNSASGAPNDDGATYVAYLFAHNAGGFGLTGADNVISCGSYVGDDTTDGTKKITLGYEPQFLIVKPVTTAPSGFNSWNILDIMRGIPTGGNDPTLIANGSGSEDTTNNLYSVEADGFRHTYPGTAGNDNGITYLYIAIRRGPMKVPTSGTSVFSPVTRTGTGASTSYTVGFVADLVTSYNRAGGYRLPFTDRLRGITKHLLADLTNSEGTNTVGVTAIDNTKVYLDVDTSFLYWNESGQNYINYAFRRAPNFFDEVCYTGTGSATTFTHNLTVVPELMIAKCRNDTGQWAVYSSALSASEYLFLNSTGAKATNSAIWNSTSPTSSVFSVGTSANTNSNGFTFVAYLFATCAGVSKVGSYTGTGTTLQVNCGFTAGARFVLIKRTDSTGDWYVWDTTRGIISGNDPYLILNGTAAEVTNTDYIDTYSPGFELSSTAPAAINANGGTYIFLAIA